MARADRFPAGPAHRDFRRLAAALAASQIGDWLYNVALLTVVYERTKSPTWVALTTAARVAPIVVLGPLGGVVADRFDRRRVMIVSDAVRMAIWPLSRWWRRRACRSWWRRSSRPPPRPPAARTRPR